MRFDSYTSVMIMAKQGEIRSDPYHSVMIVAKLGKLWLQVFTKCGILKEDEDRKPKVKVYRDRDSQAAKGDGLVTYLKEPSVSSPPPPPPPFFLLLCRP